MAIRRVCSLEGKHMFPSLFNRFALTTDNLFSWCHRRCRGTYFMCVKHIVRFGVVFFILEQIFVVTSLAIWHPLNMRSHTHIRRYAIESGVYSTSHRSTLKRLNWHSVNRFEWQTQTNFSTKISEFRVTFLSSWISKTISWISSNSIPEKAIVVKTIKTAKTTRRKREIKEVNEN